jgi:hypothetical protein
MLILLIYVQLSVENAYSSSICLNPVLMSRLFLSHKIHLFLMLIAMVICNVVGSSATS